MIYKLIILIYLRESQEKVLDKYSDSVIISLDIVIKHHRANHTLE